MHDENPYRSPSLGSVGGESCQRRGSGADGKEVSARQLIAGVLFLLAFLLVCQTVSAIESMRIAPTPIVLSAIAATLLCWLGMTVWREAAEIRDDGRGGKERATRRWAEIHR